MRTFNNLPPGTPINTDSVNHPNGGIKNETATEQGTPVVEEVIGDPIANIYKIIRDAGIEFNNQQDNETNGYQFLEALKLTPNNLNDKEQVLNLTGSVFFIGLKLSLLPEKYFVIAKASESYNSSITYTFKGSESDVIYPFTSSGFSSGDELLLIVDSSGVKAHNLSVNTVSSAKEVFPSLGTPISFNDSNKLWYLSEGKVFNDDFRFYDVESTISDFYNTPCEIYESFLINGYIYFLIFKTDLELYEVVRFNITNFSTFVEMTGLNLSSATDNFNPYLYTDGKFVWITNETNTSDNDSIINKYRIDGTAFTLISSIEVDSLFLKSNNTVVYEDRLYSLISATLKQTSLLDGITVVGSEFSSIVGYLFNFNGKIYYCTGEVAKLFNPPTLS